MSSAKKKVEKPKTNTVSDETRRTKILKNFLGFVYVGAPTFSMRSVSWIDDEWVLSR